MGKSHHPTFIIDNHAYGTLPIAQAATTDTSLGETALGTGDESGLAVAVVRTITNPPTTGNAPNAGMQYLEIDLSVSNHTSRGTIVLGTFYYQTAAGNLLNTADTVGNPAVYPNKNVQVVGKSPLIDLYLSPEQTDSSHYLIYQVPIADHGKLIWFDGYYDTDATKLAVFDLQ
jgi:hypothetical protein